MVVGRLVLAALAGVSAVACTRTFDPCGEGTYRQGNRCVAIGVDAARGPAMPPPDAGTTPDVLDAAEADAEDAAHAAGDAQPAPDATLAAEAGLDAALADAQTNDAQGADAQLGDAGQDDAGPALCYGPDIARWADFHLNEGLAEAAQDCAGFKTACAPGTCSTDECLRLQAGVTSCNSCVSAEAACLASACRSACGVSGDDDRCRACACASGCVDLFAACANSQLDVCADCTATTCVRASLLSPALIMVVVDGML